MTSTDKCDLFIEAAVFICLSDILDGLCVGYVGSHGYSPVCRSYQSFYNKEDAFNLHRTLFESQMVCLRVSHEFDPLAILLTTMLAGILQLYEEEYRRLEHKQHSAGPVWWNRQPAANADAIY